MVAYLRPIDVVLDAIFDLWILRRRGLRRGMGPNPYDDDEYCRHMPKRSQRPKHDAGDGMAGPVGSRIRLLITPAFDTEDDGERPRIKPRTGIRLNTPR